MKRVPLTQGQVALVDDEDYERVMEMSWHACRDSKNNVWYAKHTQSVGIKKWKTIQLHKFILRLTGKQRIDHKNGDGLDNQKENLRPCTPSLNGANRKVGVHSSPYKGVDFDSFSGSKKWRSQIMVNQKKMFLGRFETPEQAARIYDEAAIRHYGDFARTNQQMGLL